MIHELLAESRRDRIRAVRGLAITVDAGYALRRVLYADRDAEVRAAAARRLAEVDGAEPWLLDALGDRSPLVRDGILRALAKRGTHASVATLAAIAAGDRMWWVRRSAIYALAAIGGVACIDAFKQALDDPFWRVRHAAVRVLAVLGARDLDVRDDVLAAPPSTTLTYLRAAWGPVSIDAPDRAASAKSLLPAELLDPDPAVVTARLAAGSFAPVALVELLCDPHAPLRILAAQRIAASTDRDALVAALDWLEEPRIPHVADTVEHLLDGLGDHAVAIAEHALARPDRPGAVGWAIAWVVATRFEALYDLARTRAVETHHELAAIRIASATELVAWSADPLLADAAAAELHERRAFDALQLIDGSRQPRVRALQLDAAARTDDWAGVEAGLADPHHGPRAVATRWLVRTKRIDGVAQLADPDPAVREAAMTAAHGTRLDPDPWVARAAIRELATAWRDREVPADVAAATTRALASPDPWIRAQACRLPIVELAAIVGALGDRDEMVRAAAADAMVRVADPDVRALLDTVLPERTRVMVYAWLLRRLDGEAGEVARAALAGESAARIRELLVAIATLDNPAPVAREPAIEPVEFEVTPAVTERRRFGRAGFDVAPLAISGAFDLAGSSLHHAADAGVDLFFWEPSYDGLTRFLRSRRRRTTTRVMAGSYHAEPDAIERNVDQALRRLHRDALDVFLLFWTRSPARIDDAGFESLARLQRAGKVKAIGFSTHHRELARAAIESRPWDVVMIRHSAAHPGIETELLPTARERDTAIITFSALCYGRMVSGDSAPSAADCYRYSLAQPGVTACISAPRRHGELVENLAALHAPALEAAQLAALRDHGKGVRVENQRFNTLLRQPTRDAAAAAREMLAAELPPADTIVARPLPRSGASRGARTSLGSARRGKR